MAAFLVVIALDGMTARAQVPADVWLMYMKSGSAANKAGDDLIAGVLFRRALESIEPDQMRGQRAAVTYLALAATHYQLRDVRTAQEFAQGWRDSAVPESDPRLKDYITTLSSLGWSYYDRWKKIADTGKTDDATKRDTSTWLSLALQTFRAEAALRSRFMPEDKARLAQAVAAQGLILSKIPDVQTSLETYDKAWNIWDQVQAQRVNATKVAGALAARDARVSDLERMDRLLGLTNSQFTTGILSLRGLVALLDDDYAQKNWRAAKADFRRAEKRYWELVGQLQPVEAVWRDNPTSAQVRRIGGWLYSTAYTSLKDDAALAGAALQNGKIAFEEAIAMFDACCKSAGFPSNTANEYASLLRGAGDTDSLRDLAKRYTLSN